MKIPSILLRCLGPMATLSLLACASDPASPEDFVLPGTWSGVMTSTIQGTIGDFVLTLVGEKDGETEDYGGNGTLTSTQLLRRFSQVQAEYNTVDRTLLMTILDLSLGGVFEGTYDGTNLFIADSVACFCEMTLVRE